MNLPMTIHLAWTDAKIGFVFSQRGVVMEAASAFFLPRLIGHSKALYLATTGSVLAASSPHFGHLFHELLPKPSSVLPRALTLASQIARQTSTVSTYLMRMMMYHGPNSAEGAHLLDSELMWELYAKEDKKEGIEAWMEKREPEMKSDMRSGMPGNVPWWEELRVIPHRGVRHEKMKATRESRSNECHVQKSRGEGSLTSGQCEYDFATHVSKAWSIIRFAINFRLQSTIQISVLFRLVQGWPKGQPYNYSKGSFLKALAAAWIKDFTSLVMKNSLQPLFPEPVFHIKRSFTSNSPSANILTTNDWQSHPLSRSQHVTSRTAQ
ncbi:uncharacterized protein RAG0_06402 [Rhynchosporium agropyri]|uniref:Enoyl-CoA hydratase n=1 Tax=Rhynchosporium agropyri TaxID=914238 RepID=A0A1E1KGQ5_9HELO|nr:uncharacterized protein RAG0_06402 [Rhynchosporium agropyri]